MLVAMLCAIATVIGDPVENLCEGPASVRAPMQIDVSDDHVRRFLWIDRDREAIPGVPVGIGSGCLDGHAAGIRVPVLAEVFGTINKSRILLTVIVWTRRGC